MTVLLFCPLSQSSRLNHSISRIFHTHFSFRVSTKVSQTNIFSDDFPAMGCSSSSHLNLGDDFSQVGGCHHHFVKLTSTTYGLLNLDSLPSPSPPLPSFSSVISAPATPMTPPQRFTIVGKEPMTIKPEPEVINFWELMSGFDADTSQYSPLPVKCNVSSDGVNKEKSDPNWKNPRNQLNNDEVLKQLDPKFPEKSERLCPPGGGGEERVVIYTTSLRGVRRTFEACNAVRTAIGNFGVVICERDISMDRGFRDELTSLMDGDAAAMLPPRVFVKGRYIGGAEEVMGLVEDGTLGDLLRGIPREKDRGGGCDECGGLSFLPCSGCSGSCKVVEGWGSDAVVKRCMDCNENGLVRCPICS